jgi:hypothetical protein
MDLQVEQLDCRNQNLQQIFWHKIDSCIYLLDAWIERRYAEGESHLQGPCFMMTRKAEGWALSWRRHTPGGGSMKCASCGPTLVDIGTVMGTPWIRTTTVDVFPMLVGGRMASHPHREPRCNVDALILAAIKSTCPRRKSWAGNSRFLPHQILSYADHQLFKPVSASRSHVLTPCSRIWLTAVGSHIMSSILSSSPS